MVSVNHRLDHCVEEQQRISTLGGKIAPAADYDGRPQGPLRVWPGGLQIARAIGDADCELVSAHPDVCSLRLSAGGALVLATDGLWDTLPAKSAALLVFEVRNAPRRRLHSATKQDPATHSDQPRTQMVGERATPIRTATSPSSL